MRENALRQPPLGGRYLDQDGGHSYMWLAVDYALDVSAPITDTPTLAGDTQGSWTSIGASFRAA